MDTETVAGEPIRRFDSTDDPVPALAIIHEVAALEGVDPMALPPLGYAVDVDVLDAVVKSPSAPPSAGEPSVSFSYVGYEVTVKPSGTCSLFESEPKRTEVAQD